MQSDYKFWVGIKQFLSDTFTIKQIFADDSLQS